MGGVERAKQNVNRLVYDVCFNIRPNYVQKIRNIVRECAIKFEHALKLMVKNELSPTYLKFLCGFTKCSGDRLCEKGINICKRT